jgi:histidinol dehydrogenase
MADSGANPAFIAADLLSQAEHGPDSQVVLITNDALLIGQVETRTYPPVKRAPQKSHCRKSTGQ